MLLILIFLNKENFISTLNDELINDNIYELTNDTELINNYKIEKDFNCYVYGCNSSRNDMIELVGVDQDTNHIFKDSNNLYKLTNGFLDKITNYNLSSIIKNESNLNIPIIKQNDKLKLKIELKYLDYNFYGYLSNNYYSIQYLLYGKPIETSIENDILYEYIAVKIIENIYKIIHKLPVRAKMLNMETIWIDYGPIQLGPLLFTTKLN
jgi:hypothetical protein